MRPRFALALALCAVALSPTSALALEPQDAIPTALSPQVGGVWRQTGGAWLRYDALGSLTTGWFEVDGSRYWSDASGVMATGWRCLPDGRWYWFGSSGALKTNAWLYQFGTWYYLGADGAMATGWRYIQGSWYLFGQGGAMLTGWQYSGGRWYYLSEQGNMLTGWQTLSGGTYHFASDGAMTRQWFCENGRWYFLGSDGALRRNGWLLWNGTFYYVDADGVAATGWRDLQGARYYFDLTSCEMRSNAWVDDRYLGADGAMLVSTKAPNGELVGADGVRLVVDPAPTLEVPYRREAHGSMEVWRLGTSGSGKVVYYLHGGSYDCGIGAGTWSLANAVCAESGAEVLVAAYPLAPFVTFETAYDQVLASLRSVIAAYGAHNVILMGDSAGGGFAAGLIGWMEQRGEEAPSKLALVSPWLDITCSSAEALAARAQGWDADGLMWEGWRWAGEAAWEIAPYDVRLCPLYHPLYSLDAGVVIWGDSEPFAGDARAYAAALVQQGARVRTFVGKGLGHDWALDAASAQTADAVALIAELVRG